MCVCMQSNIWYEYVIIHIPSGCLFLDNIFWCLFWRGLFLYAFFVLFSFLTPCILVRVYVCVCVCNQIFDMSMLLYIFSKLRFLDTFFWMPFSWCLFSGRLFTRRLSSELLYSGRLFVVLPFYPVYLNVRVCVCVFNQIFYMSICSRCLSTGRLFCGWLLLWVCYYSHPFSTYFFPEAFF